MSDIFGGPPDDEQYDAFGYPIDYGEVEDPYGFWGGNIPDPYWSDRLTLYDDDGNPYTLTVQQWYDATMQDMEYIENTYNMSVFDIIYQLQWDYEIWDSEDWRVWREHYALVTSG